MKYSKICKIKLSSFSKNSAETNFSLIKISKLYSIKNTDLHYTYKFELNKLAIIIISNKKFENEKYNLKSFQGINIILSFRVLIIYYTLVHIKAHKKNT